MWKPEKKKQKWPKLSDWVRVNVNHWPELKWLLLNITNDLIIFIFLPIIALPFVSKDSEVQDIQLKFVSMR